MLLRVSQLPTFKKKKTAFSITGKKRKNKYMDNNFQKSTLKIKKEILGDDGIVELEDCKQNNFYTHLQIKQETSTEESKTFEVVIKEETNAMHVQGIDKQFYGTMDCPPGKSIPVKSESVKSLDFKSILIKKEDINSKLDETITIKIRNKLDTELLRGKKTSKSEKNPKIKTSKMSWVKIYKFSCSECDTPFTREDNMKKHLRTVHNMVKMYTCDYCDSKFRRKHYLIVHISSVHLKLRDHKCNLCESAFSTQQILKRHVNTIHKRLKLFKCLQCGRRFSHKKHVFYHTEMVHEKIKRYECSECNRSFCTKQVLQRHIEAIHTKIKKLKCSECDEAFVQSGSLTLHIDKVHLKTKRFICSECPRAFFHNYLLKQHLRVVHGSNAG